MSFDAIRVLLISEKYRSELKLFTRPELPVFSLTLTLSELACVLSCIHLLLNMACNYACKTGPRQQRHTLNVPADVLSPSFDLEKRPVEVR